MSWHDRYREASYRGVPFFVPRHTMRGGKRGQLHQYVGRDEPWFEEQGRKAREFRVDAYVIGADYDRARDNLIAALETPGAARLVHPYLGSHTVVAQDFDQIEDERSGGEAGFTILFVEAGRPLFPSGDIDILRDAVQRVLDAIRAVVGEFARIFQIPVVPDFLAQEAGRVASGAADTIRDAIGETGATSEEAASLRREITRFQAEAPRLASTPQEFGDRMAGLIQELGRVTEDPDKAFALLSRLATLDANLEAIAVTTSHRETQERNRIALLGLIHRAAIAKAAEAAARKQFRSREEALAFREALLRLLDDEIESAGASGDDESFRELQAVFRSIAHSISERAASLGRVVRVHAAEPMPSLVVAYRLYEDPERADEIAARNQADHPGFVGGQGSEIEVLSV